MGLAAFSWQEKSAQALEKMRAQLPGGVLIYGPRGVGTFELADNFARSVVCSNPQNGAACGVCAECRLTEVGNHPDLRYVLSELEALKRSENAKDVKATEMKAASKQILIEQVREIGEFLSVTSHRGGNKAVVVYPADAMTADQSSALLKTLEEPPAGSIIILAADDLQKILPTIRSRCQLVKVTPPTREQAIEYLKANKVRNPEDELARVGGMPLLVKEKDSTLILDKKTEAALLDLLAKGEKISDLEVLSLFSGEPTIAGLVSVIQRWLWDVMAVAAGASARYYVSKTSLIEQLASRIEVKHLFEYLKALNDAAATANHPLNKKLVAQDLLITYAKVIKSALKPN